MMMARKLLTCNCREQHHQHHVTPKQVAVEDSWVSAHVTIANDDGAEIAHIQIPSHLFYQNSRIQHHLQTLHYDQLQSKIGYKIPLHMVYHL